MGQNQIIPPEGFILEPPTLPTGFQWEQPQQPQMQMPLPQGGVLPPGGSQDIEWNWLEKGELFSDEEFQREMANAYRRKYGINQLTPLPAGFMKSIAGTFDGLKAATNFVAQKTGLPQAGVFDYLSKTWHHWADRIVEDTPKNVFTEVLYGLGHAFGDIQQIQALGKWGLPTFTGAKGFTEGIKTGKLSKGLTEAGKGAVYGTLLHHTIRGIGMLPSKLRLPAWGGLGAGMTPGDLREKITGAITWAVLGMTGGNKRLTLEQFIDVYPKIKAKMSEATAKKVLLRINKKAGFKVTAEIVKKAGGAKKVLDAALDQVTEQYGDLLKAYQKEGKPTIREKRYPFLPKDAPEVWQDILDRGGIKRPDKEVEEYTRNVDKRLRRSTGLKPDEMAMDLGFEDSEAMYRAIEYRKRPTMTEAEYYEQQAEMHEPPPEVKPIPKEKPMTAQEKMDFALEWLKKEQQYPTIKDMRKQPVSEEIIEQAKREGKYQILPPSERVRAKELGYTEQEITEVEKLPVPEVEMKEFFSGIPMPKRIRVELVKQKMITPEESAMLEQFTSETWKPKDTFKKIVDQTVYQMFDRWSPHAKYIRELERLTGEKIPPGKHPVVLLHTFAGREGDIVAAQESLRQILVPFRRMTDKSAVFSYMASMRAIERERRGFDNPNNVTAQQAKKTIQALSKRLGKEKMARVVNAANQFYAWADKEILQRLLEAKVISKKGYQTIKSQNKYWLPYEVEGRLKDKELERKFDVDTYDNNADFFGVTQNVLYGLKGTVQKVRDPFVTVMKRLTLAVNLAEKNKILFSIIQASQKHPWAKAQVYRLKPGEQPKAGLGTFGVVINGRVQKWTAPNDIIGSLQQLGKGEFNLLNKTMGKAGALFRAGTTSYYLPFSIANVPRDIQMAILTSKYKFNPRVWTIGFLNSLASSYGMPTPLYWRYLKAHAGFGGLIHKHPKISAKQLWKTRPQLVAEEIINPLKFLKNVAQTFEMGTRLAVFREAERTAKKEGWLKGRELEVGLHARRATIDFSRAGVFMKMVNMWVPFLNARMQAKVTLAEALFSTRGIREGKGVGAFGMKGDPRAMAAMKGMLWVMMPAITTYAYNRIYHGKLIDQIPDDIKDKYFCIVTGEKWDDTKKEWRVTYIKIPKGDVGTLLFNPVEHFLDWAVAQKPLEVDKVLLNVLSELAPADFERGGKFAPDRLMSGITPPLAKAPYETWAGKSMYWGRELVPERLKRVEPREQFTEYTQEPYKEIGRITNLSPIKLQNFARNLLGSIMGSPTPKGLIEAMRRRIVSDVKTKVTQDFYQINDKAKEGYYTARLRAQRLLEAGDKKKAYATIVTWNKKMPAIMGEMSQLLQMPIQDLMGGSFYKEYTFQKSDWKRLLKEVATGYSSALERKLGFKPDWRKK